MSSFVEYADIEREAQKVGDISRQTIGIWCTSHFPRMINILLKLNYFIENSSNGNIKSDPAACYVAIVHEKYIEAPHSLYACNDLMVKGHYLNAIIQARALFDSFVTCKYLYTRREHAIPYLLKEKIFVGKDEKYLGMGDMYKALGRKKFYDKYWGDILSNIAHAKPGIVYFRINKRTGRWRMVPEFDINEATIIINMLMPVIYGFIINYEHFFEGHVSEIPVETREEAKAVLALIKKHQDNMSAKYAYMADWLGEVNALCDIM